MYGVCRDFDQLRPKHSCSVEVGGKNAHFSSIILGLACLHVGQAFTDTALFPQATSRGRCVGVGPAVTMGRLKAEYPEVTSGCCDFKFKGRGQRNAPVGPSGQFKPNGYQIWANPKVMEAGLTVQKASVRPGKQA